MLNLILQSASVTLDETVVEQKNLLDMIKDGGWTMVPLFILSLIAIFVFVERLLTLSKASKNPAPFMATIKEYVLAKNINEAIIHCEKTDTPIARMIGKGLRRLGNPLKAIEESIESVGKLEIDRLEKNLSLLATIAGAAPMVGFLGTVLGMIKTFNAISMDGDQNITDMASGISEAMITTATGLIVGIIAYVTYNFLSSKLQKIIHNLEFSSIEFLDVLQEPQK